MTSLNADSIKFSDLPIQLHKHYHDKMQLHLSSCDKLQMHWIKKTALADLYHLLPYDNAPDIDLTFPDCNTIWQTVPWPSFNSLEYLLSGHAAYNNYLHPSLTTTTRSI